MLKNIKSVLILLIGLFCSAFTHGTDPAAQFLSRISTPTAANKALYEQFFTTIQAANIPNSCDAIHLIAVADAATGRTNLISASYNLTVNGSETFVAYRGYTSDGSTGYLDSGYNPVTSAGHFTQNSATLFAWVLTHNASNTNSIIGNLNARLNPASGVIHLNNAGSDLIASGDSAYSHGFSKLWLLSRFSSSLYTSYNDGAIYSDYTTASITPSNYSIWIGGENDNGATDDLSLEQIAADGICGYLSPYQVAVLRNAIQAYLYGVGAPVAAPANLIPPPHVVSANQFGMIVNFHDGSTWPTIPFGVLGEAPYTAWHYLETSRGVYDWTNTDQWVNAGIANNANQIIYPFSGVPSWTPVTSFSTTETDFAAFVTSLVTRYKGKITAYEMWQEAYSDATLDPTGTNGTTTSASNLAALMNIAVPIIRSIDPAAKILYPDIQFDSPTTRTYYNNVFTDYALLTSSKLDGMAIHSYATNYIEEYYAGGYFLGWLPVYMETYGLQGLPVWNTEGGSHDPTALTADQDAVFIAQLYFVEGGSNVSTINQYDWAGWDTLWNGSSLTVAGVAYQQIYNWTVGKFVSPVTQSGSVWTQPITGAAGYRGLIVWDAGTTGYDGSSSYAVPSWATQYRDLAGTTHTGLGATVTINMKPIIFEN